MTIKYIGCVLSTYERTIHLSLVLIWVKTSHNGLIPVLFKHPNKPCPSCQTLMCKASRYDQAPPFLLFICHDIKVKVQNEFTFPGINQRYRLCGIIYFANYHFVCRVIDKSGGVWYHNGNENNNKVLYIGNIVNYDSKKLQTTGTYEMKMAIYTTLH